MEREKPLKRDYIERAYTVGIGGPVGSGKTALMYALCKALRQDYSVVAVRKARMLPWTGWRGHVCADVGGGSLACLCQVTNDIFTQEDGEFLVKHSALPPERIQAIETGGCPHAAIREDISANLQACEELTAKHNADLVLVESGGGQSGSQPLRTLQLPVCLPACLSHQPPPGSPTELCLLSLFCLLLLLLFMADNLAANFSRELADYIIYVIDVAGGDKVPRKGGPGITQSDLLVRPSSESAIS